jgi:hypothetical protein
MWRSSIFAVCAATAFGQNLAWINPQNINLDQNGSGTLSMVLANSGNEDIPLELSIDQFVHSIGDKPYTLKSAWSAIPPNGTKVPKNGTLPVTIMVTNIAAAGVSKADIRNGNQNFKDQLTAIRVPVLYNVQVISPTTDNPQIHVVGGHALFTLKNGDPIDYPFRWQLRYDGRIYEGGSFVLPAGGTKDLELPGTISSGKPAPGPMAGWIASGTLKDEVQPAALLLSPDFGSDATQPLAAKELPVSLDFSRWSGNLQEIVNAAFTFLLLAVGGIASLLISCGIPNTKLGLSLNRQIRALEQKIHGLDSAIDSRWRVFLESYLPAIHQELDDSLWVIPSFGTTAKRLTDKLNMVQQWVDIVYDASVLIERVSESAERIPPTVMRQLRAHVNAALMPIESGFTKDTEITTMRASLSDAQRLLDLTLSRAANPDLEKEIKARAERVELDALAEALGDSFHGFINRAREVTDLSVETYMERDIISVKIHLLHQYAERLKELPAAVAASVGGGSPAPIEAARARLQSQRGRLTEYLIPDTHESLRLAALIVEEMGQDIYDTPDGTLRQAVKEQPPSLRIQQDPDRARAKDPVRFCLSFDRPILNEAVARQEWACAWDFGDESRPEVGWKVSHYFEKAGDYQVQVKITDLPGSAVTNPPLHKKVTIDDPLPQTRLWGPENLLELGRLGVVLAIALIGLMATAQQQVRAMSFPEAAAAVVALGFGADTVKNIILSAAA